MRRSRAALLLGSAILAACSSTPSNKGTLATLRDVPADTADVRVEGGLDTAMQSYQKFLEETPESAQSPEAMASRGPEDREAIRHQRRRRVA